MSRVAELAVAPIKGFGLSHPESLELTPSGPVGDRAFYLVEQDGTMAKANYDGSLLDWWAHFEPAGDLLTIGRDSEVLLRETVEYGEPVRTTFFAARSQDGLLARGDWSDLLSDLAGSPLRLVRATSGLGGQDVEPLSLVSMTSVEALGRETDGRALDHRRFRMNIAFDGAPPFAEESWIGRRVHVGEEAIVRLVDCAARCSMVQRRAGDNGDRLGVLKMLANHRPPTIHDRGRSLDMGVYARVEQAGTVRVGDLITIDS